MDMTAEQFYTLICIQALERARSGTPMLLQEAAEIAEDLTELEICEITSLAAKYGLVGRS